MKRTRIALALCVPLLGAFLAGPPAAAQGCSVCTTGGECMPVETSGNCYCHVRHTDRGFRICRPVGVCDLLDSSSCDDEGPPANGVQVAVDTAGLRCLEDQDPLIGTAIRAAAEQTFAPNGAPTGAFFRVGIQEGTLKNLAEESGYAFRVVVSPGEGGSVKLHGTLTSEGGKGLEFRAHLSAGGRSGKVVIERDSRNPEPRTLTWSGEKAPKAE